MGNVSAYMRLPVMILDANNRSKFIAGAVVRVNDPNSAVGPVSGTTGKDGTTVLYWSVTTWGQPFELSVSASGYFTTTRSVAGMFGSGRTNPEEVTLVADGTGTIPAAGKQVTLSVTDPNNGQPMPVAGAHVFLDGKEVGVTNSGGQVPVYYSFGDHQLSVNATQAGYAVWGPTATTCAADKNPIDNVQLVVAASAARRLTLVMLPAAPDDAKSPLSGSAISFDGESGQVKDDGTWTTSQTYPDGTYLADVLQEGWVVADPAGGVITVVASKDSYAVTLIQDGAKGNTPAAKGTAPSSALQGQPVPFPPLKPAAEAEFVYPNSDFGKYFSITQARLYIGSLFIDELDFCQYTLQANRTPVYGYCSRDFDAVGQGRALVQGQLGINFVSEGYLYTVLKDYARRQQGEKSPQEKDQDEMQQLQEQRRILLAQVEHNRVPERNQKAAFRNSELVADPYVQQLAAVESRIGFLSKKGSYVFNKVEGGRLQLAGFNTPADGYEANALYLPIAFDVVGEFERPDGSKASRRLEQCWLGANDQVMSHDGQPIKDVYSFIARRLR